MRNGKLAVRAARGTAERVAVYDPAQGESEERSVRYEARLRHALEENTLGLAFEPQLDLSTGRIAGLECKLRWTDERAGRGVGGARGRGGGDLRADPGAHMVGIQ